MEELKTPIRITPEEAEEMIAEKKFSLLRESLLEMNPTDIAEFFESVKMEYFFSKHIRYRYLLLQWLLLVHSLLHNL